MNLMKKYSAIILLALVAVFSSACEEVIDINLNSTDPKIVANGSLELDRLAEIRLSYSMDYFNPEEPEYINDAIVVLSDGNEIVDTLVSEGEGVYHGTKILGEEDMDYQIMINNKNEIYQADCYLPKLPKIYNVIIDTIGRSKYPLPPKVDYFWLITINIEKPKDYDAFYALEYSRNDTLIEDSGYDLVKDYGTIEDTIPITLVSFDTKKDDIFKVVIKAIDERVYDYYHQVNDVISTSTQSSTAPYNPQSNIDNGMLGYFSAYAELTISLKMQPDTLYFDDME